LTTRLDAIHRARRLAETGSYQAASTMIRIAYLMGATDTDVREIIPPPLLTRLSHEEAGRQHHAKYN
jgi:hypothetical protein